MPIRHFIPLAIAVIAGLCAIADRTGIPPAPIAAIAIVGAALLTLQLEDHRLGNVLGNLTRALKSDRHGAG
ncbi:MAG: hypothetical protein ABI811_08390 [Acidobacteriota bacterium]